MPKEWWEDFFSGIVLDLWKEVFDEHHTKAEADFILKILRVPNGAAMRRGPPVARTGLTRVRANGS